jgi:hypothetical protein
MTSGNCEGGVTPPQPGEPKVGNKLHSFLASSPHLEKLQACLCNHHALCASAYPPTRQVLNGRANIPPIYCMPEDGHIGRNMLH